MMLGAELALAVLLIAGTIVLVYAHRSGRMGDWLIEHKSKPSVTDEIEHDREQRAQDHLLR